jgi:hypothetical protein
VANSKLLTTRKLIDLVTLKSLIPTTQNTFLEKDFLSFINEEMDLGLIPHIMMYNEDYFLFTESIPLVNGVNRYTIPSRAIGTKLRDICYNDGTNLHEMTRISVEDLVDNWTNLYSSNLRSFYIEGDEIVIPNVSVAGSINVSYYIRPNSIVSEDDTCSVVSINKNNGLVTVDKYPEKFIGITSFDITSSKSSFRLVSKEFIPDGIASELNLNFTFGTIKKLSFVMPSFISITGSSYIQVIDNSQGLSQVNVFWFDKTGFDIAPIISGAALYRVDIVSALTVSDVILSLLSLFNSSFSDNRLIMQQVSSSSFSIENGGLGISVGDNFYVSASFTLVESIVLSGTNTVPSRLNINDVIALPEETTIPQIPIELHAMLAQRVSMRCLEALGDAAGLQAAAAKLVDMESKTAALIDNRVESAPIKISPRHTPIKRATSTNRRG